MHRCGLGESIKGPENIFSQSARNEIPHRQNYLPKLEHFGCFSCGICVFVCAKAGGKGDNILLCSNFAFLVINTGFPQGLKKY